MVFGKNRFFGPPPMHARWASLASNGAPVVDSVCGVKPQAVDVIFVNPMVGILDKELATIALSTLARLNAGPTECDAAWRNIAR